MSQICRANSVRIAGDTRRRDGRHAIRVLAFARLREILGAPELSLELPDDRRVDTMPGRALLRDHPCSLRNELDPRVARNGRLVSFDESLCDGDELALLPPVGGG